MLKKNLKTIIFQEDYKFIKINPETLEETDNENHYIDWLKNQIKDTIYEEFKKILNKYNKNYDFKKRRTDFNIYDWEYFLHYSDSKKSRIKENNKTLECEYQNLLQNEFNNEVTLNLQLNNYLIKSLDSQSSKNKIKNIRY